MMIEVASDVHRALLSLTGGGSVDDVLRGLLQLDGPDAPKAVGGTTASVAPSGLGRKIKGVWFPEGTRLRMSYEGIVHYASIKNGKWTDEKGTTFSSPSDAATYIKRGKTSGWPLWDCMRPQDTEWIRIVTLRTDARRPRWVLARTMTEGRPGLKWTPSF